MCLSDLDSEPGCDEQDSFLPDTFPANKKIVYCFTSYAGAYPPTFKINSDSRVDDFFSGTYGELDGNYYYSGACALIEKSKTFSCDAIYKAPPVDLIEDITYDASSPDLKASCSSSKSNKKAGKFYRFLLKVS